MTDIRLALGAGSVSPAGFTPMGREHGSEIYPLAYPDNSVDAIYASHVLEHFHHWKVADVVKDWARALKPGGTIKIAVPDFAKISEDYLTGKPLLNERGEMMPAEHVLMGAQRDPNDVHHSMFDRDRLRQVMAAAGLILLRPWKSEIVDCAAYDLSLNLEGTKPHMTEIRVSAAMSVPRLGFMDNFSCCIDALLPLNIRLRRQGGAFWGQALTKCLEIILEQDKPDAVLTLDYDSVFTKGNVAHLMQLMMAHPEADAIVALQSSRHMPTALFTLLDEKGKARAQVELGELAPDLMQVASAHFGLTLIRADKLRALPKPWFMPVPDAKGGWSDDGKIDEDIHFWVKWREAGNTLFLANRCTIGHAELMVRWPGKDLQAFYQPIREFNDKGAPEAAWR